MERTTASTLLPIGAELPHFVLPNVDGTTIADSYLRGGKFALVIFTCNHCPYVKGSEEELIELIKKYEPLGLRTVSINSNDASKYEEDSFEHMKEKAQRMKLPYPYLHDESQKVAKAFDAACTPEVFLFDLGAKLVFHGTVNDNPKDKKGAHKHHLEIALAQAFAAQMIDPQFVHPIGCSIKWK